MIRKYIFSVGLTLALGCINLLVAQDCTPEALASAGISPDALPLAQKGIAYNETISVMLFADTMVERQGQTVKAVMDSMILRSINGLPEGMSFKVKDNNPKFLPLTPSCISIFGTPTELGIYPLEIPVFSYAKVLSFIPINQADTIRDYILEVVEEGASIKRLNKTRLNVFPNPSQTTVAVFSNELPRIMNLNGQECYVEWVHKDNYYSASVEKLPAGIYLILGDGKNCRFVKN
jgi:hypothetical protein